MDWILKISWESEKSQLTPFGISHISAKWKVSFDNLKSTGAVDGTGGNRGHHNHQCRLVAPLSRKGKSF